ncbi:hypothetical protein, partial [Bacillus paralicheniformis]|uniref:hypothetical protein n=1 Tax=Bacillus paralicheniformis TaxID=1648923 RepID=UPI0020BFFE93
VELVNNAINDAAEAFNIKREEMDAAENIFRETKKEKDMALEALGFKELQEALSKKNDIDNLLKNLKIDFDEVLA